MRAQARSLGFPPDGSLACTEDGVYTLWQLVCALLPLMDSILPLPEIWRRCGGTARLFTICACFHASMLNLMGVVHACWTHDVCSHRD